MGYCSGSFFLKEMGYKLTNLKGKDIVLDKLEFNNGLIASNLTFVHNKTLNFLNKNEY